GELTITDRLLPVRLLLVEQLVLQHQRPTGRRVVELAGRPIPAIASEVASERSLRRRRRCSTSRTETTGPPNRRLVRRRSRPSSIDITAGDVPTDPRRLRVVRRRRRHDRLHCTPSSRRSATSRGTLERGTSSLRLGG